MKIVCAGMRRSGSTWQYNVARLILATTGKTHGCFEDDYDPNPKALQIVKTHKFMPPLLFGADLVLISRRDLRDVAASAVRRGLSKDDPMDVLRYLARAVIDEYELWKPYADYETVYEAMMKDRQSEVQRIADKAGIKVDAQMIANAVADLPIGDGYDPETLLHPDHITDGRIGTYAEVLSKDTIAAIETMFVRWQTERGYVKPIVAKPAPAAAPVPPAK